MMFYYFKNLSESGNVRIVDGYFLIRAKTESAGGAVCRAAEVMSKRWSGTIGIRGLKFVRRIYYFKKGHVGFYCDLIIALY